MADIEVKMDGIVEPTYNKRRKGYTFKKDGLEIFIKGEDKDVAMKQMSELLEKEQDDDDIETHSFSAGGYEDGGLKDEGGSVDPVSGNDVPVGSTQKEVRDDIPAQLSEGEFVLPADVVRFIGLENLMELRNKAKRGLAQMEDMGQMGNSEEATMDDTADLDVDIDALIESFDPNEPETQNFAEGGMPTYQYQPQQNIYSPNANYNPYTSQTGQQQQFSYGYMPQTTYTPPAMQAVSQSQLTSARPAGGSVEQRQYIGPNGELRTFTFIDGKPTEEIPAGFKVYKPEEQAAPQITTPQVQQPSSGGDGGGNREQEAQREAEYAGYVSEMNQLASLNPDIASAWGTSPHNPANRATNPLDAIGNFIKMGGIAGALKSDFQVHQAAQKAAPTIASQFGLDINNYTKTGLGAIFGKYDTDSLARDAAVSREVAESLGMDPRDLARTEIDTDRDGRISIEEAKKAEADLFMDEDGIDYSSAYDTDPGFDDGDVGGGFDPGFDDGDVGGGFDPGFDSGDVGDTSSVSDGGFDPGFDEGDVGDTGGGSDSGGGSYCCTKMVDHQLWKTRREFAMMHKWHREQPQWWRDGYDVWGNVVAETLLKDNDPFWTSVMQSFYDHHVKKQPHTLKSALANVIIYPGVAVYGAIAKLTGRHVNAV
jgi:hypothetical protein